MRWRFRRGCAGGVPYYVCANTVYPLPPKSFRPKNPQRGQPISRLVEPSPNGLPLQPPPSLGERAEGKFHLSLQECPLKPPSSSAISYNREVIAYHAGSAHIRGNAGETCQGRPAASGFRDLGVVDIR